MSDIITNNHNHEDFPAHSFINGEQYHKICTATTQPTSSSDHSMGSHTCKDGHKPESEQPSEELTPITNLIPNLDGHEEILLDALWALALPKGPHAEQTFKVAQWTHTFSAFIAPSLTERSNAWLSTPISQLVRDELVRDRQEGLPELNASGRLPPGIHHTTFNELSTRFATNSYRITFAEHLEITLHDLREAGVREVVIGGSFVSSTTHPGDIDMVYVRNASINQYALITALWNASDVNIHAWAADREHMPIAGQPFDPTRRFSFLQFLRTYQEKVNRRTTVSRELIGVVHLSLDGIK